MPPGGVVSRRPRPIRPAKAEGVTRSGIEVLTGGCRDLLESFAQPATAYGRRGRGVKRPVAVSRCRLQPIPAARRRATTDTMTTQILQLSDLHPFADPDERLNGIPTREL